MPKNWTIGDRTGTCGEYAATNDVTIIWPQNKPPFALSILYTNPSDLKAPSNEKLFSKHLSLL